MFLRASKKSRSEIFLYDPIGTDKEGNEITLIDILGTDPDSVSELVEKFYESRRLEGKAKKINQTGAKGFGTAVWPWRWAPQNTAGDRPFIRNLPQLCLPH